MHQFFPQFRLLYREQYFHTALQVSRHPVRTGTENLRRTVIFEIKDTAVLQKVPHNGTHADIFAHPRNPDFQAANPPDNQLYLYPCRTGFVQSLYDILVAKGVHLCNDMRRAARLGIFFLPGYHMQKSILQPKGCQGQFIPSPRLRIAGEHIEDCRCILANLPAAGKHPYIGI